MGVLSYFLYFNLIYKRCEGWFSIRNVAMSWKKLKRQWVDSLFHHRWKWHFTLEFGMWNIQKIFKFFYLSHFTWVGGKYTDMVEREEFKAMWLKWTKTITKPLNISVVVRPHFPRMLSTPLSVPVWTPFTEAVFSEAASECEPCDCSTHQTSIFSSCFPTSHNLNRLS